MLAGLVSAQVESQNIVGYVSTVNLAANYFTMVAPPFSAVGGTAIPVASLFSDNSSFIASDTEGGADTLKVWNGTGYDTYFFSSDADNKWASGDDSFSETTATLPAGSAFWFFRRGAALTGMTVAGQVLTTNVTVAVAGNYFTMVGNPFAAPLPIKSLTAPGLIASDTEGGADTLKVWNGTGYDTYFYSSDADNKWASGDDSFSETTATLPAGSAFWFFRRGVATSLTLPVPFVL